MPTSAGDKVVAKRVQLLRYCNYLVLVNKRLVKIVPVQSVGGGRTLIRDTFRIPPHITGLEYFIRLELA